MVLKNTNTELGHFAGPNTGKLKVVKVYLIPLYNPLEIKKFPLNPPNKQSGDKEDKRAGLYGSFKPVPNPLEIARMSFELHQYPLTRELVTLA